MARIVYSLARCPRPYSGVVTTTLSSTPIASMSAIRSLDVYGPSHSGGRDVGLPGEFVGVRAPGVGVCVYESHRITPGCRRR